MNEAVHTSDECVTLGRRSLHQLRSALERSVGVQTAPLLQEAGFVSGEALFDRFSLWLADEYQIEDVRQLDATFLEEALSRFFAKSGWGVLTLNRLGESVMMIDSPDWAESNPGTAPYPSCHLSSGIFADIFTRMSGGQFAAMEVECRTRGDTRCRFLLASPETLTLVYERMTHGLTYEQSLGR